jgi:hypothetical protein
MIAEQVVVVQGLWLVADMQVFLQMAAVVLLLLILSRLRKK